MAKKKSQNKKHKFKYAEPTTGVTAAAEPAEGSIEFVANQRNRVVASAGRATGGAAGITNTRDFSYVGQDLRRIGILAGSLLALEIVLWYLFAHTGVGHSVYNLVKV